MTIRVEGHGGDGMRSNDASLGRKGVVVPSIIPAILVMRVGAASGVGVLESVLDLVHKAPSTWCCAA